MSGGRSKAERQSALDAARAWRSLPLEAATRTALALTIFFVVCGSSSMPALVSLGSPARWVALAAFTALAFAWAAAEGARAWDLIRFGGPGMLLTALGFASVAWSVSPRVSFERAVAFAVLTLGAAACAAAIRGRPDRAEGLAEAVVAATVAVCLAGPLLYAINPTRTAQSASPGEPFRFAGMGQSPDTVPMLAALGAVLAAWFVLARRDRRRLVCAAVVVGCCAEIAASGSRGAALSLGIGVVVLGLAAPASLRGRAALLAAAVAVAAATVVANRIVQSATALPLVAASASPAPAPSATALPRAVLPPFQNELGAIPLGGRTLFGNDGRALAWEEAFEEGSERAVAGWGFGTENGVFIERVAQFQSVRAENSYLGLYLELGAFGVVAWLLAGLATVLAVVRARRLDARARLTVAGLAAAVAAGFGLGVGQSYVYSAGNLATLPFWLVAAAAVAVAFRTAPSGGARVGRWSLAAAVLVVAAVPIGIWESGQARAAQNAGIRGIWRAVGSRLDTPALDGFRRTPPLGCLLYAAGGSPGGYELCFDGGRLVEGIDRRDGRFQAWTVQPFGAWAATLEVPPAAVDAQLRRLGAYAPSVAVGFGYLARRPG